MSFYDKYYHRMPDGTIKQISPFSGTEVWCVEERRRGNAINRIPEKSLPLERHMPEDYCHFCDAMTLFCTPEKARIKKDESGTWVKETRLGFEEASKESPDFRRIGNLFEIVTYDYWNKNYGYKMNTENREWMDRYLASRKGFDHAMNVLELKLSRIGIDTKKMSLDEKLSRLQPFFGGCHELILGRRHYIENAEYSHELCSSGELGEEAHFEYMKFTVETLLDIYGQNPFIRYISVFQNWLRPAGASFDHLHRQLVGLDEWGVQMEREIAELRKDPNLYNEYGVNFAIYNDLIIAENDFAIALTEIGHRFPTVSVYSKSENARPFEHTPEEIRGMSDMVYAVHNVISAQTTCNEEWYYSPFDSIYSSPWHITIKLRINTPAGFEGNTKIYINPISPEKLSKEMTAALQEARDAGKINPNIRIGGEVNRIPNVLQYYKTNMKSFYKC